MIVYDISNFLSRGIQEVEVLPADASHYFVTPDGKRISKGRVFFSKEEAEERIALIQKQKEQRAARRAASETNQGS
jgi:hypothetical protein